MKPAGISERQNVPQRQECKMPTISIANATVSGEWIEGDIVLNVTEIGFSTSKHFKTKKDVEQNIDLGEGITLTAKLTLEPPNNVCIAGRVHKDFLSFDIPKQCFAIG
jgi:hypothetical protein